MMIYNGYSYKRYVCYFTDTGCIIESDSLKEIIKIFRGGYNNFGGVGYLYVAPSGVGKVNARPFGRIDHGKVVKRYETI